MTVDTEQVKDFRGLQATRPVQLRALAARFRAGETLEVSELKVLRDYAGENGLLVLHERVKTELRNA
jgi:hypothetical protein